MEAWNDIFNWRDSNAQIIEKLPDTIKHKILTELKQSITALEFYWDIDIVKKTNDSITIKDGTQYISITKGNFFYKLRMNPDYQRKDSLNRFAQLYNSRDSIMADNVLQALRGKPVIVWAHNDHIAKPGVRMMGDYLNRTLNNNYFNLLTAYNKGGEIVTYNPSFEIKKLPDPIKTSINEFERKYNVNQGIIFSADLLKEGYKSVILDEADISGTWGGSVLPANSFNTLVILGQLFPRQVLTEDN